MRESAVEAHLIKRVRAVGGVTYKTRSGGGFPDRVVIRKYGLNNLLSVFFVELKRPGGKLRKLQEHAVAVLRGHGQLVFTLTTKQDVDIFIRIFCS